MPIALYMQLWRTTKSDWNCYTGYFLLDQNIISPIKPKCDKVFEGWKENILIGSKTYCLTNKNFQKQFPSSLKKSGELKLLISSSIL